MSSLASIPTDLQEKAVQLSNSCPLGKLHPRVVNLLQSKVGEKWMVACSGGADSLFCLLSIWSAYPKLRGNLTVLHFNHKLRAAESDKDEIFIKEIAETLKISFVSESQVGTGKSDEASLRDRRREFFCNAMAKLNGKILLQGHHLDDVAETFLWRIARGVGVDGMCAPRPIQIHNDFSFARPLLCVSRIEIHRLLKQSKIPWREDQSNQSDKYLRNRLRKNTLPNWKNDSDRDLLNGILQTRELIEEQADALSQWADEALISSLENDKLSVDKLIQYPRAIIRKVIFLWLSTKNTISTIHQNHLNQILDALLESDPFKIQLSSTLTLHRRQNFLSKELRLRELSNWSRYFLPLNSFTFLPNKAMIHADLESLDSELKEKILKGKIDQNFRAYISVSNNQKELFFRQRKPGDRFTPLGSNGSKKVKDCMIDRRWDQHKKENCPLVTDQNDKILWIPGFPPDHSSRITVNTTEVIRLTYMKSET